MRESESLRSGADLLIFSLLVLFLGNIAISFAPLKIGLCYFFPLIKNPLTIESASANASERDM